MKDNAQLLIYAVTGIFVLLIVYPFRDYIVIGLVGAGSIYVYKLANEPDDRKPRR